MPTFDVAVRLATQSSGTLGVKWQLSGEIDGIDFGPTTIDKDNISCDPKVSGGGFECSADSPALPLPGSIPSPLGFFVVKLGIGVKFDVTPKGAIVTRGFAVGGNSVVGPDDLLANQQPRRARSSRCRAPPKRG